MTSPRPSADARVLDPVEYYHSGPTAFFASQRDQRFSYCLYVPGVHRTAKAPLPLTVVVHGTQRMAERYRDAYRGFAEENETVVLAPLFPAGIGEAGDLHGFKRLSFRDVRFDRVLLDIVDEVAQRYRVDAGRFALHGFSGGGQFVHRFAYLHARRLSALSVGAPGRVTRINPDVPWWPGTADLRERFGVDLDLEALRAVPVQMIVGADDVETWEIAEPGVDAGGDTRVERLTSLRDNFEAHGIGVRLDVVPGLAHRGLQLQPVVQEFFAGVLAGR
ncbi:alpha/beta hydrolase [Amycolatopsis sp. OK19-0408]|uniref:Alpha/beta hydrolase n=1 Tax=Amycolatopsis iheyensis TaxID=2945988 RepID=A0A9X2N656_9PSEU|nr:alpha/beta hydrolase [Amycolatopsis iheyensis]MCR6483061.1 alpha/beta hydrolase [Amycolatopsis iheyensis]